MNPVKMCCDPRSCDVKCREIGKEPIGEGVKEDCLLSTICMFACLFMALPTQGATLAPVIAGGAGANCVASSTVRVFAATFYPPRDEGKQSYRAQPQQHRMGGEFESATGYKKD